MKHILATLTALGLVLAITFPAFAGDPTIYSSIRMQTFYVDGDDGSTDTKDLKWTLQGNTHIGVDFEVSDAVFGNVELDIGDGIELSAAFGVWDFGPGNLMIGQDSAPFDWGPDQVAAEDNDMAGYGSLGIDAAAQMTVNMDNGLYLSLFDNTNDNVDSDDIELPLLAVGFNSETGNTAFGFGAAYTTYEKATGMDANTWVAYAQAEQDLGAVTLLGKIYYGQNLGELGGYAGPSATYDETNDEDADTLAGFLAVAGQVNDKVSYLAAIGYATTDRADYSDEDAQLSYYVQFPIEVSKGFQVVPSVAVFDKLDDTSGNDEGSELYVGAKWQFDL